MTAEEGRWDYVEGDDPEQKTYDYDPDELEKARQRMNAEKDVLDKEIAGLFLHEPNDYINREGVTVKSTQHKIVEFKKVDDAVAWDEQLFDNLVGWRNR